MKKKAEVEAGPDWGAVFSRVFVGALFVVSGFSKASYPPEAFAAALEGYKLFPDSLLMPIATVVPWVELLAGAYLLAGFQIRRMCVTILGLLAVFEGALLSVIMRNIDLGSCGCYGAYGPHFTPPQAATFDFFLILMALYAFVNSRQPYSLDSWIEKGL
jgi:uncharacterized membrane protein YphA (DoxX/SURF4 family)